MEVTSTVINLLLGLGIFLYGMQTLEQALESLGSGRVKQWLGRATDRPLASVASGTVITAILQSSSMVSLIVLAFASAGVIPLFNAVGVILGANLGTTFTGWIVATIGFKLDLESLALPIFGLAALARVFSPVVSKRRAIMSAVAGLGLLLFGLSLMKDSVSNLPKSIHGDWLSDLNLFVYLLIGIGMTALIQSSSAMTMIALTALNADIVSLSGAAAIVVGADIGTTSTTVLGSLRGQAIAKRLALAHLIYNLSVDSLAFLIMIPLLPWLLGILGISDPLYGLVLFHTSFNFLGLFIFIPILKPFSQWLESFFVEPKLELTQFLHRTPSSIPEAARVALLKELRHVLLMSLSLNLRNLKIKPEHLKLPKDDEERLLSTQVTEHSFEERYQDLKKLEGKMNQYARNIDSTADDNALVIRALNCARHAVYAAKTLKDIRQDLVRVRVSRPKDCEELLSIAALEIIFRRCSDLTQNQHKQHFSEQQLQFLKDKSRELRDQQRARIIQEYGLSSESYDDLATLMNINQELWHSLSNTIEALELWSVLYREINAQPTKQNALQSAG